MRNLRVRPPGGVGARAGAGRAARAKKAAAGRAAPYAQHGKHGSEGDGAGGVLSPDEEVEDEHDSEHDAGEEEGGEQRERLPLRALESLVGEGGAVAGGDAHQGEEQQRDGQHRSAVRGREEAEHRARDRDEGHAEHLHARPDRGREPGGERRRAEDVGVHELPARLLEQLLLLLHRVVLRQVPPQRPHHNHRDDARQQQHYHERVQDGEPVDLVVAHVEVEIPAARPRDRRVLPHHVVRVHDLVRPREHRSEVGTERHRRQLWRLFVPLAFVGVLDLREGGSLARRRRAPPRSPPLARCAPSTPRPRTPRSCCPERCPSGGT